MFDYSLLVGVKRTKFEVLDNSDGMDFRKSQAHTRSRAQTQTQARVLNPFRRDPDGAIHAALVEGPGVYYFGIIDVLRTWRWQDSLERNVRTLVLRQDREGITTMPPEDYAKRFWDRVVRDGFEYVENVFPENIDIGPENDIGRILHPHSKQREGSASFFDSLGSQHSQSQESDYLVSGDVTMPQKDGDESKGPIEASSGRSTSQRPRRVSLQVSESSEDLRELLAARPTDSRFSVVPLDRPTLYQWDPSRDTMRDTMRDAMRDLANNDYDDDGGYDNDKDEEKKGETRRTFTARPSLGMARGRATDGGGGVEAAAASSAKPADATAPNDVGLHEAKARDGLSEV